MVYYVTILITKMSFKYAPNPLTMAVVRGFFSVAKIAYLSLRLRSQCVNKATMQPLITVAMIWTKMSFMAYAPPLYVKLDARDRRQ